MTSKRQHKKIARQLPPEGTTLTATYKWRVAEENREALAWERVYNTVRPTRP